MEGALGGSLEPAGGGFDFTLHMRRLCGDLCARLPELGHIDLERVAIRYCQTRKAVRDGVQATLTPLRFPGGSRDTVRGGRKWTIQRLYNPAGGEWLYLLSFYLPRFLNHPFREKLATVVHELWHIGPDFDGDLRRLPGRCYAHGHAQRHYDAAMERLVDQWLGLAPALETYRFLQSDFRELRRRYGTVWGLKIATPKLIPAPTRRGLEVHIDTRRCRD